MKKKILFVMNSLYCGGAEKSLISLLETIDYDEYEVDLYLLKHEGDFLCKLPKKVRLLKEPKEYRYFDMAIFKAILLSAKIGRLDILVLRILAGLIFKTEKNSARCEQKVWRILKKILNPLKDEYDAAIGFLEKNPIYFCVDKVSAKKKIGFIHTDYKYLKMDPQLDRKYFCKLNNIVAVSEGSAEILKNIFPIFREKIRVIYNIVSPFTIKKLSMEYVSLDNRGTIITSVGRLDYFKGFTLAVEACGELVSSGYDVKWYVIGEGSERRKLEKLIEEKGLKKNFFLVGYKENPYPYIEKCDIYVQTSVFEGRCLTITEAKILEKPIVSTNFKVIHDQIKSGINGLIVNQNSKSIYEGIVTLINNQVLNDKFKCNLKKENFGTQSEIKKFYELIN